MALRRQQGNLLKVGDNLRWLSRLDWFRGRGEEARKLAMEAIEVLEQLPPGPELAMAYSNMAQLHMLSEDGPAGRANGASARWSWRSGSALTEVARPRLEQYRHGRVSHGQPRRAARKLERSLELALDARACTSMPRGPIPTSPTWRSYARDYARAEAAIGRRPCLHQGAGPRLLDAVFAGAARPRASGAGLLAGSRR